MELQRCPGTQDLATTTHPYHQSGWPYWWYSAPTPQQSISFKDHKEKKDEDPWAGLDAQSAFLGPNLWGTPQDQNFKLEYADLEEFLEDNEPPRGRSAGGTPGAVPADSGPPLAPPQRQQQQPQGPQQQHQQPQHPQPPQGHQHGHQQPPQRHQHGHQQPQPGHPQQQHPPQPQQGHQQQLPQQPQQAHPQQRKQQQQQKQQCPTLPGSDRDIANGDTDPYRAEYKFENGVKVKVEFQVSPTDLALASGPGAPDFDPQTRQFSDEELKPQPMCKKSKKQVVPDDRKDQKYWTRRQRNNSAAKRSRDARRLKENQIALRASFLEKENSALREAVDELTKKNQELQNELDSCTCR